MSAKKDLGTKQEMKREKSNEREDGDGRTLVGEEGDQGGDGKRHDVKILRVTS